MVTVNQAAKLDIYPLPRANDLLGSLAGGKKFITLDLAHAYQQIPLDEGSKNLVTIIIHKGLYAYNCVPLGCHLPHGDYLTQNPARVSLLGRHPDHGKVRCRAPTKARFSPS